MTTTGAHTLVYNVSDLTQATAVFTALIGEPHTSTPYYVGFSAGGQEVGLAPHDPAQGTPGPVPFFHVDDLTAAIDALTAAGGSVAQGPREVGGGRQVATVADADGSPIGLLQDR